MHKRSTILLAAMLSAISFGQLARASLIPFPDGSFIDLQAGLGRPTGAGSGSPTETGQQTPITTAFTTASFVVGGDTATGTATVTSNTVTFTGGTSEDGLATYPFDRNSAGSSLQFYFTVDQATAFTFSGSVIGNNPGDASVGSLYEVLNAADNSIVAQGSTGDLDPNSTANLSLSGLLVTGRVYLLYVSVSAITRGAGDDAIAAPTINATFSVPEPTSLAMIAGVPIALLRRRRRMA